MAQRRSQQFPVLLSILFVVAVLWRPLTALAGLAAYLV